MKTVFFRYIRPTTIEPRIPVIHVRVFNISRATKHPEVKSTTTQITTIQTTSMTSTTVQTSSTTPTTVQTTSTTPTTVQTTPTQKIALVTNAKVKTTNKKSSTVPKVKINSSVKIPFQKTTKAKVFPTKVIVSSSTVKINASIKAKVNRITVKTTAIATEKTLLPELNSITKTPFPTIINEMHDEIKRKIGNDNSNYDDDDD